MRYSACRSACTPFACGKRDGYEKVTIIALVACSADRYTAGERICRGTAGEKAGGEHTHNYDVVVTASTCSEQGYTTYSCACGDSYMGDYTDAAHTYLNNICTDCGVVLAGCIWQIVEGEDRAGAYADLQAAVDACENGHTVRLTADCAAEAGASIEKDITIDGGNHLVSEVVTLVLVK